MTRNRFSSSLSAAILGCAALLLTLAACNKAPEAPPQVVNLTANDQMKFSVIDGMAPPLPHIAMLDRRHEFVTAFVR